MAIKLPYLSDDHHFAIAIVAAKSAELDHLIDTLLYLTIEPEDVSLFILKNVNSDRLVELLRLALGAELAQFKKDLDGLFERVKTVRTGRNQILHWLSESTESKDIVRFTDKRRGRERKPKDLTANDIQNIAIAIGECVDELVQWWNAYNWYRTVRSHGKSEKSAHPPYSTFPKKLRPSDKLRQHERQPRKPPS